MALIINEASPNDSVVKYDGATLDTWAGCHEGPSGLSTKQLLHNYLLSWNAALPINFPLEESGCHM